MRLTLYNKQGQMHHGWRLLLYYAAYFIVLAIFSLPVFIALQMCHREVMLEVLTPFLGTLAGLGVSAIALKWEGRPFHSLGFALGLRWSQEFGLGIAIGVCTMVASALLLLVFGGFHWNLDPVGSIWNIGLGVLIFLTVAMNEEIAFRGYPFQLLLEWLGSWPALIVLALPFAALHLGNQGISSASSTLKILTIINIVLFSLLMGFCFMKTRSLALPVGLHLGWNWTQGNLMGFGVSGTTMARGFWTPVLHDKPLWLTGGSIGIEGSVVCTLILILTLMGLIFWKTTSAVPPPSHSERRGETAS